MPDGDTIFALSSGAPPAAIAILRVSGPAAGDVLVDLAGKLPPPRQATLRTLRTHDGALLDQAMVLWLPGPRTATGEDLAELHLHGGRATIAAAEQALRLAGLRPALGGEFTRRALENGRIDLAQAEGLADLLAAETEVERKLALATTEGQISRALQGWYERLTGLSTAVEARLDHADEDDVAANLGSIDGELCALRNEIAEVLARPTVARLRDGPTIVLAGPPNAGKSSLFNALIEREGAIVTPIAGTTRDVLDAAVTRGGRTYRIIDTAGLNAAQDPVERIGVERAQAAIASADLTIWLGDEPPAQAALWINARCDLPGRHEAAGTSLNVSARRSETLAQLWQAIETAVADVAALPFLLSDRQRDGVMTVKTSVREASESHDDLITAECLRVALRALDNVLGRYAPEAMLDALFARFCIGK